jgi:hypothetical protein
MRLMHFSDKWRFSDKLSPPAPRDGMADFPPAAGEADEGGAGDGLFHQDGKAHRHLPIEALSRVTYRRAVGNRSDL